MSKQTKTDERKIAEGGKNQCAANKSDFLLYSAYTKETRHQLWLSPWLPQAKKAEQHQLATISSVLLPVCIIFKPVRKPWSCCCHRLWQEQRAEQPAQCPRGDWRVLMLEKSRGKDITRARSSAVSFARSQQDVEDEPLRRN